MKLPSRILTMDILLICLISCSNELPISGNWMSTEPFGDEDALVSAKLNFAIEKDTIVGAFTFVDAPETLIEELGFSKFQLQAIWYDDNLLSFILPLHPRFSDEDREFTLKLIGGNILKGKMSQPSHPDKGTLSVEFSKQ